MTLIVFLNKHPAGKALRQQGPFAKISEISGQYSSSGGKRYVLEETMLIFGYILEEFPIIFGYVLENIIYLQLKINKLKIIPIEVKTGTNAHLRSLHTFVNFCEHPVTAIRIWSGEFLVQDAFTPAPFSKPYKLINIPFYLTGLIDTVIEKRCSI